MVRSPSTTALTQQHSLVAVSLSVVLVAMATSFGMRNPTMGIRFVAPYHHNRRGSQQRPLNVGVEARGRVDKQSRAVARPGSLEYYAITATYLAARPDAAH